VLTERRRFGGSLADLDAVHAHVNVPVLRKHFIVEDYQLWKAHAHGADLALLMVVSLSDTRLADLIGLCARLGLTALVESHTAEEGGCAVASGAELLGINSRDLTTLKVNGAVIEGAVRVAGSGVADPQDVAEYHEWGADVVLVAEALVRSGDPRTAVQAFIETANTGASRS
jgi:indole-3-glycerol phosphate synthase